MSARIRAVRSRVDPTGPPPQFRIRTDRAQYVVEATMDPILLNGALAGRRTAANFHASSAYNVRSGRATYALDPGAWRALRRFPNIYYRLRVFNGTLAAPRRLQLSTADHDFRRAPTIHIAPVTYRIPPVRGRLSGGLTWLRVEGNRVVNAAGDSVVLRGVNRSGMEYSDRNGLDPTGVRRATSRAVAGITRAQIREITQHWGANVIRLPINQEWVLSHADYLTNLDQIIRWAAAEGAYTILDLQWFDTHRDFGTLSSGKTNRVPPMPEENSIRMWRMLAARYRFEPAVLYDIFNEPHVPLASDSTFLFQRPANESGWLHMWHSWVRRLESIIHSVNARAMLFVSGWDWALNLRHFPVPLSGGRTLPNAVYSAHVYFHSTPGRATTTAANFDYWFGFQRLRLTHPIFVGEWGGNDGHVGWGHTLESYLNRLHRYSEDWIWPGLFGWTAWSWADDPLLVERLTRTRGALSWRTFEMDDGHNVPTEFGKFVRVTLRIPIIDETGDAAYANALDNIAASVDLDIDELNEFKKWAHGRNIPIADLVAVAQNTRYKKREKLEAMKVFAIAHDAVVRKKLPLAGANLFNMYFLPAIMKGRFRIDLSKKLTESYAAYSYKDIRDTASGVLIFRENTLYIAPDGINLKSIYQRAVVIHEGKHVIQDALAQESTRFASELEGHDAGTQYLLRDEQEDEHGDRFQAMKPAAVGFELSWTSFHKLVNGELFITEDPVFGKKPSPVDLPDRHLLVLHFLAAARDNLPDRAGQNVGLSGLSEKQLIEIISTEHLEWRPGYEKLRPGTPGWMDTWKEIYLKAQSKPWWSQDQINNKRNYLELKVKKDGLF